MTSIKFLKKILSLILLLFMVVPAAKAQDTGAGHKVLFQLTDGNPASQKALSNQLKNLTKRWPDARFEVVVHSAGIGYLQKSKSQFAEEIKALSELGVKFKACENTLTAKGISKQEILDEAGFVPMGIGEIILRQEEGWSYIKAGL